MSYAAYYSAVFYITTITTITLGCMVLARAYINSKHNMRPAPVITLWVGITILLLGLKQGVWMMRMMLVSAGLAPASAFTDEASTANFVLSIFISLAGLTAVSLAAYRTGGNNMLAAVGGSFAMLCALAVVIGGMNG